MSEHPGEADGAKGSWHSGRPSRAREKATEAIERRYGVEKPDVIGDFLRERVLDGVFDDQDGDCPCGSGKSYWACHGERPEGTR
jgi:integrase